jgi:hypothetical protein
VADEPTASGDFRQTRSNRREHGARCRSGQPRPVVYLDLDGPLLRRRMHITGLHDAYEVHDDALPFLEWCTARFRCRWLTTRCRDGDAEGVRRAFRHALGVTTLSPKWNDVLVCIEPTRWSLLKTEAIDFDADKLWFWIDDDATAEEMAVLAERGFADHLIRVDPDENRPLLRVRSSLERALD